MQAGRGFLWFVLGLMLVSGVVAQPSDDPLRFVRWPVADVPALVRGLTSPRMGYVLAGGTLLVLASRVDEPLGARAAGIGRGPVLRVIEEVGNVKAVRPVSVLLFIGTLMSGQARYQDAAFTSMEAILLANPLTNALKTVLGRARPWQDEGAGTFHPFSGNTAFPSGHAATVFAFVTPWFLYYPHWSTAGLMVLAGATAFSRMATNVHWFTDVVGGSAIGFFTAFWLTRRHQRRAGGVVVTPALSANHLGLRMRF